MRKVIGAAPGRSRKRRGMERFQGDEVVDVHDRVDSVQFLPWVIRRTRASFDPGSELDRCPTLDTHHAGLDGRKLAGQFHAHPLEPVGGSVDLLPKPCVVFRHPDRGGDPTHSHAGSRLSGWERW